MSVNYNPGVVTSGLVLCYDAANQRSYPGSGTAWKDISGNGNTGTLTNGPAYNSANMGSIVFDGVDDFVTLPGPMNFNGDFAYCAWVYRSVVSPNGYTNLFTSTSQNEQITIDITGFPGGFGMYINGACNNLTTNVVPLNQWVHLIWQRYNTGLYGYLNGVEQLNPANGNSYGYSTVSTALSKIDKIGAYSTGTSYNLNGKISDVQIYSRALSATEITQNFNALRGRYGI